jgi:hypothetical protein
MAYAIENTGQTIGERWRAEHSAWVAAWAAEGSMSSNRFDPELANFDDANRRCDKTREEAQYAASKSRWHRVNVDAVDLERAEGDPEMVQFIAALIAAPDFR